MRVAFRLMLALLAGVSTLALKGQTITSVSHTYDTADGLVHWSFTLNEGAYSSFNVDHIVLGFDGTDGLPPPVFWQGVGDVTVYSSSFTVSKVDVWTDSTPGRSYLELNLNTPPRPRRQRHHLQFQPPDRRDHEPFQCSIRDVLRGAAQRQRRNERWPRWIAHCH